MRALVLVIALAAIPLGGCANESVRVVNLSSGAGGRFTFSAQTNTVMTENDDGAAERIRRDWLAGALTAGGICHAGYVVDSHQFVQPGGGPFANGGDIVYFGRCL